MSPKHKGERGESGHAMGCCVIYEDEVRQELRPVSPVLLIQGFNQTTEGLIKSFCLPIFLGVIWGSMGFLNVVQFAKLMNKGTLETTSLICMDLARYPIAGEPLVSESCSH